MLRTAAAEEEVACLVFLGFCWVKKCKPRVLGHGGDGDKGSGPTTQAQNVLPVLTNTDRAAAVTQAEVSLRGRKPGRKERGLTL